jgi:hypothetical protein
MKFELGTMPRLRAFAQNFAVVFASFLKRQDQVGSVSRSTCCMGTTSEKFDLTQTALSIDRWDSLAPG